MKKTYDLRINSRGNVQPMECGFFENTHDLVYSTPISADDLITIETPTCFVRVRKDDVSTAPFVEHIRSYFARHRVHPQRPCFTQLSTKKGQWINDKVFSSEEDARTYVNDCNARLAPFADSPYVAEEEDVTVVNEFGVRIAFDAAVPMMDDELREEIHRELAPCTEQEFFDAYATAHEDRFGETWELAKANPRY